MNTQRIKIKDIGRVVTGKTPPTAHAEYFGGEYMFIKPSDISLGERRVFSTETRLSDVGAQYLGSNLLPKDTTCVVCIGTLGKLCLTNEPCFTNQQLNSVVVDTQRFDPLYVFYQLSTILPQLKKLQGGSASGREHVNKSNFENIQIEVHPLPIQQRISSILSAYDDLIENNTRRSKILEEMAQSIYREWFVNFRFPGHAETKSVEQRKGQIPADWQFVRVGDVLQMHIGGGWGAEECSEDHTIPAYVIRGTDIPNARLGDFTGVPLRFHKESNFRSRKLQSGDIVFEVSGGSKGQPVGRALLVNQRLLTALGEDVICASFCKLLRSDPLKVGVTHLYEYLLDSYTNGQIEKYQVQSTGITNFKFAVFLQEAKIAVPPRALRIEFETVAQPIVDAVCVLGRKNAVLRQTRDFLLPKLMSGEISVEEAEREAVGQGA